MKPRTVTAIVEGKSYNTETAVVVAHDAYWDGSNFERYGRNTFLYRTLKGNYFATHLTCWQGKCDSLEPLTRDEAVGLYKALPEHDVDFEDAFPWVEVEEA